MKNKKTFGRRRSLSDKVFFSAVILAGLACPLYFLPPGCSQKISRNQDISLENPFRTSESYGMAQAMELERRGYKDMIKILDEEWERRDPALHQEREAYRRIMRGEYKDMLLRLEENRKR